VCLHVSAVPQCGGVQQQNGERRVRQGAQQHPPELLPLHAVCEGGREEALVPLAQVELGPDPDQGEQQQGGGGAEGCLPQDRAHRTHLVE
jgi:hypothetical protein